MSRIVFAALLASVAGMAHADADGELFAERCGACHLGAERADDRKAPPVFAVKNHYIAAYPERESFVAAVANHLLNPGETLMPGAVERFGAMPQQEVTPDEARRIAEYIHDNRFHPPGWYREHYRQEHGTDPSDD